tara:strand:+ start:426 stop:749 length:324 start_codon:yes stop_codon:yes gene_type:complete
MSRNNKTLNYQPENLFVVTGQEDKQTPYDWDGMPEFNQPEAEAWKVLKVRFRNEEDLRNFAEVIDQTNITLKTKGIWYPPADKTANSLLRYMDEGQISEDNIQEIVE